MWIDRSTTTTQDVRLLYLVEGVYWGLEARRGCQLTPLSRRASQSVQHNCRRSRILQRIGVHLVKAKDTQLPSCKKKCLNIPGSGVFITPAWLELTVRWPRIWRSDFCYVGTTTPTPTIERPLWYTTEHDMKYAVWRDGDNSRFWPGYHHSTPIFCVHLLPVFVDIFQHFRVCFVPFSDHDENIANNAHPHTTNTRTLPGNAQPVLSSRRLPWLNGKPRN